MDRMRLLIADASETFAVALADALRGSYHVRISREGRETLELMRTFSPDILVLDLMLPGMDGITLLKAAAAADMRPVVLAATRFVSEYVLDAAEQLEVGYLILKPCEVEAVAARVADLTQRITAPVITQPDPRATVSNLLLSLGVPTKLRGYSCLREAVILMQRDLNQSITKELYPAVAVRCGGTGAQVERAIRSAIHAAWMARNDSIWRHYFSCGEGGDIQRPTNGEFISCLADMLFLDDPHNPGKVG